MRNASGLPKSPSADEIHAQVEKILASPRFVASKRHTNLLRHLVDMFLAGRTTEIKEHVLAVRFFGRGESFDPRTDAIVRTEVWRLRAKLNAYYHADGCNDNVIIELPPRTYVPVFRLRGAPAEEAASSADGAQRRKWLWVSLAALVSAAALIVYACYSQARRHTSAPQSTQLPRPRVLREARLNGVPISNVAGYANRRAAAECCI